MTAHPTDGNGEELRADVIRLIKSATAKDAREPLAYVNDFMQAFAVEHARLLSDVRGKMPEESDVSFTTAIHGNQSFNHGYAAGRNEVIHAALAVLDAEIARYEGKGK
jgi:hypothetical protein